LLQNFRYKDEPKQEWWVFTCKGLRCDYEMYDNELPARHRPMWDAGERL
jgi:hypothetical protein